MKQPTCHCNTCAKCEHRERMREIRAAHRPDPLQPYRGPLDRLDRMALLNPVPFAPSEPRHYRSAIADC
jgi:hypothetical protein